MNILMVLPQGHDYRDMMTLPYLVNLNNEGLPESLREHAFISYLFNAAKADHARIIELEQQVKSLREHN